jgi:hypothetical protein
MRVLTNAQIMQRLRQAGRVADPRPASSGLVIPASDPGNRAKRFLKAKTMEELRELARDYGLTFNEVVAEHKRAFKARYGI